MPDQRYPLPPPDLGEVDTPKCQTREEHHCAFTQRTLANPAETVLDRSGTVGMGPSFPYFGFRLLNTNSIRCVCHLEWAEIEPMFRPRQPARMQEPVIQRSCRIRSHESKHRKSRRPCLHDLLCSLRHPWCVAVHAENEGRDRVDSSLG